MQNNSKTSSDGSLVSIIMPIYNTNELYLCRAIESVIKQTYSNWELIIVDDGSTDNNRITCEKYIHLDSRIKIIHKSNEGVSAARNSGLKICNGRYVSFIDSDDIISDEYVSYLVNILESNDADISVCCCNRIKEGDVSSCEEHSSIEQEKEVIVGKKEAIENLCYMREQFSGNEVTAVWGKLYKKEICDKCEFEIDLCISEDFFYNFHCLLNSNKIVIGSKKLYTYILHNNSLLHSTFDYKRKKALDKLMQLRTIDYEEFNDAVISRIINSAIIFYILIPKKGYKAEKKELIAFIKKDRFKIIKNKNARKKLKIALRISYFGFGLMSSLYKIFNK